MSRSRTSDDGMNLSLFLEILGSLGAGVEGGAGEQSSNFSGFCAVISISL